MLFVILFSFIPNYIPPSLLFFTCSLIPQLVNMGLFVSTRAHLSHGEVGDIHLELCKMGTGGALLCQVGRDTKI